MRKIIITIPILFAFICLTAQDLPKETITRADNYFYNEEYEKALPLLLEIIKLDPENANLNYKVGVCYLYIEAEKDKSVNYLEIAIKEVSSGYKPKSPKERKAPLEAYYSLGTAYHINNRFDEAVEYYTKFRSVLNINDFETINFIGNQIKACDNAKKIIKKPIQYKSFNLGSKINSSLENVSPVSSGDGKTLAYVTLMETYTAVYISKNINGDWGEPEEITSMLGSDGPCTPTCLSYDGAELYFFKPENYEGNIYVSRYSNGRWLPIEKLNKFINTKDLETHASVSADGKTLYFTSNRKGGYGGLDIYKSEKDETGDWGPEKNIGSIINTEYNEETPFITKDNKRLYFSSEGHFNMGGFDIFYSNLTGKDRWSRPANMGYPVNTADDDIFYYPVDEETGLCSIFKEDSYGNKDIYEIKTGQNAITQVDITGTIKLLDYPKTFNPDDFRIDVRDKSGNILKTITPEAPSGYFSYTATPGEYELAFQGKDFKPKTEYVTISEDFSESKYPLNVELNPEENIFLAEETTKPIEEEHPKIKEIKPPVEKITIPESAKIVKTATQKITPSVETAKTFTTTAPYSKNALYTIQILALLNPVDVNYFNNLSDVKVTMGDDKFYRYSYGEFSQYSEAKNLLAKVVQMGYNDAFIKKIIAEKYHGNTYGTYTIQLMALYTPIDISSFDKLKDVKVQRGKDKFYRYTFGEYESYASADNQLKKLIEIGYTDAFIKKIR